MSCIIKEKRLQKKMTQLEVAKRLGVSRSTYAGYESGHSKPRGETAIALSKLLEIPLEKIIV